MHPVAERVRATIRRHDLIPTGAGVLVALSGGSDSVALLRLLRELEEAGDWRVVAAAHFNHQLRGAASDADQRFCQDLAASLGVPIELGTGNVRQQALETRTSIETAARRARYEFLIATARRLGAAAIAVGHTKHDQAETMLQKLVRGAGLRGLAGIHPRRGLLIRPALDIGRDELRTYLAEYGQPFCEDDTNRDLAIPRNRIRHELVPYLEAHLSPGVVDVLAREAGLARETADWLDTLAAERASTEMWGAGDRVCVSVAGLTQPPAPVARAFARLALLRLAGTRFIGAAHVEALRGLAEAPATPRLQDFPGQRADRQGDIVVLTGRSGRGAVAAAANLFRETLSVPGEVLLPELDCCVTAEPSGPLNGPPEEPVNESASGFRLQASGCNFARLFPKPEARSPKPDGFFADEATAIDASTVTLPLAVRLRRPGDRFRPLGMRGRKKLQDFFVDCKVPRQERDRVPLVVDADDRIVWVAGKAIADDFRVSAASAGVIILKRKWLGGVR